MYIAHRTTLFAERGRATTQPTTQLLPYDPAETLW